MKYNIYVNQPDIYNCCCSHLKRNLYSESIFEIDDNIKYIYPPRSIILNLVKKENIDVLLIGLGEIIDDDYIKQFTNLKYIVSPTTGIDHIRITNKDIKIIYLDNKEEIKDVTATAELTLALILMLARNIQKIDISKPTNRDDLKGDQLSSNHSIGIIGYGRIGQLVSKYCQSIGMEVLHYDSDKEKRNCSLHAALTCYFISLHLPFNNETKDFINEERLELMEGAPFLINTSRPQIINKSTLIKALTENRIQGAAMDFISYDGTDKIDKDLAPFYYEKKNLILTPHIGGNTYESIYKTTRVVLNKLLKLIENG